MVASTSRVTAYHSHRNSFRQALRRGMTPGRPLHDPPRLARVALGMLVATVAALGVAGDVARLLLIVGAFLGAIACLMPHLRPRVESSAGTGIAMSLAVYAGSLLGDRWVAAFPLMAVGFFIAGLLRAVAIGLAMRALVVVIVFAAFCEIAPGIPTSASTMTGDFALGVVIMVASQLLPPYEGRNAAQRRDISALYRAVAQGEATLEPLLAAQRSVALTHLRWSHTRMGQYAALVSLAEQIDDSLALVEAQNGQHGSRWRQAAADRLRSVADQVSRPRSKTNFDTLTPWPRGQHSAPQQRIINLVESAQNAAQGHDVKVATARRTPGITTILRGELKPGSPYLHHGLRLAATAILSMILGLWMGTILPSNLALSGHGFWVLVAGVLITFPDYGNTFARGAGRTVGTIAGAALGIAVASLNLPATAHAWVLFALFLGYLAFRSCGQPFTMFFVVAWIAGLSPGVSGALTRGIDTLMGCLVAFAVFFIAPTWHSRRSHEAFERAIRAQSQRLDAMTAGREWSESAAEGFARATTFAHLSLSELVSSVHSASMEPTHHHDAWEPQLNTDAVHAMTELSRTIGALSMMESPESEIANGVEKAREVLETSGLNAPTVVSVRCHEANEQLKEVICSA